MARSKTGSPAKENPPAAAESVSPSTNGPSPKAWTPILNRYREQSWIRSIAELAITAGLLALFWTVMLASLKVGYWLTLLLAVPTAGFMVQVPLCDIDIDSPDRVGPLLALTEGPRHATKLDHALYPPGSPVGITTGPGCLGFCELWAHRGVTQDHAMSRPPWQPSAGEKAPRRIARRGFVVFSKSL